MYSAVAFVPGGNRKGKEDVNMIMYLEAVEVYVKTLLSNKAAPNLSIYLSLVSIHCCISDRSPQSVTKTSKVSF